MRKPLHTTDHNTIQHRRIITFAAVWLAVALALFALPALPATAAIVVKTINTVDDFNGGIFHRTGATRQTLGGGDGDGEVRLQTHGINPASWYHDGNTTGLPAIKWHAAAYTNTRIYVAAGQTITDVNGSRDVYHTRILSTTYNLANWTKSPHQLPVDLYGPGMVAVGNYLYVIGGYDKNTNEGTRKVYRAQIGADGAPGAWSEMAAQLPVSRTEFATVVVSNTIYVLGGSITGGDAYATIYYAKPDASGNISAWQTATRQLPRATMKHSAVAYNGTIYVLGGTDNNPPYYINVDYVVPDADGNITQSFVSTTNLNNNRVWGVGVAFAGEVYIVGGSINNGGDIVDFISSGLITDTRHIENPPGWKDDSVLATPRNRLAAVMSDDGWIYAIGGFDPSSPAPLQSIDYGPTSSKGAAYVPAGSYTSRIFDLGSSYRVMSITWNAFVSNTVSMTLQYRMGTSPDLSGVPWSARSYAARSNTTSITNTIDTSGDVMLYQYVQFRVELSTQNDLHTPVLNAVQFFYDVPVPPEFVIHGLSAPPESPLQVTRTITYWVSDQNFPTSSAVRRAARPSVTAPTQGTSRIPPPSFAGASVRQIAALANLPEPSYLFRISFYADPNPAPTQPNHLTGAMNCIDVNNPRHPPGTWQPFIYWNPTYGSELSRTPTAFYAECSVPPNTKKFYAQLDTCDPGNDPNGWCKSYGYVQEISEMASPPSYANNIIGPVNAGQTIDPGGGFAVFLPLIRR
jgi:hypothetical protein